jgi:hypothetical protein
VTHLGLCSEKEALLHLVGVVAVRDGLRLELFLVGLQSVKLR